MNWVKAIQHATIGYGIRRKKWQDKNILVLDDTGEFQWTGPRFLCEKMWIADQIKESILIDDWEVV